MKQHLPLFLHLNKLGFIILCFLSFSFFSLSAQTERVYKQFYTASDGNNRIGAYVLSHTNARSSAQVVPQNGNRLQEALDHVGGGGIINLAEYSDELLRTRPLYVRSGIKVAFVNGTLVRSTELRDSATLVISNGSQVEWGDGAVLTAENKCTGHELAAVEVGSLVLTSGEIRDSRDPSDNQKSDAAVVLYTEKSEFTLSGGGIINTLGIENYGGGTVRLQQGRILAGLVYSPVDLWIGGGIGSLGAIVNLDKPAKIYVTSALQTEVTVWVVPTEGFGPEAGEVIAAGYKNYTLSANDLSFFRYVKDETAPAWQFALKDNQIVLTLPNTQHFGSGEELQDYLQKLSLSGQQGTEKEPVSIFLPSDQSIPVNAPIQVPPKTHVALKGGQLVRGLAFRSSALAQAMLQVPEGSSLHLDQTLVNGGQQKAASPLIRVSGRLTVEAGSIIKGGNPEEGSISSGIYIAPTGLMRLDGGQLEENQAANRGVIENAGELIIASGFVQKNQSDKSVIINQDNSRFEMTGGVIEANRSEDAVGAAIVFGKDCSVSIQRGYIHSGADTEIDTQSDIYLGGEAAIQGTVVLNEGTKFHIGSFLQHDVQVIYQADHVEPGTVIACGTGDYTLTRQDKERIFSADGSCDFVLENGNLIIQSVATANESLEGAAPFQAVVQGGALILSGVVEGASFRVYDASGELVKEGVVEGGRSISRLPGKGIFFIVCKEACIKVLNR